MELTQDSSLLGSVHAEFLPGYRLLQLLGRGGFGEVWKCEAPGGLHKAIKLVGTPNGTLLANDNLAEQEWQALQCIKEVRHPFILSTERIEVVNGQLLIVMELADRSLHEVFTESQGKGQSGILREELLDYLLEAAEALDFLNFQHGLQHLDIKPHNLFVVANHVKVADFGLVNALREHPLRRSNLTSGVIRLQKAGLTPTYAAPELLQGHISAQCDQYSLAIVYQELLTGTVPFQGKNARQLLFQHLQAEPDLSALPEHDRPILMRALAKKPEERFPSCLEMVRSLCQLDRTPSASESQLAGSAIRRTARLRRTACYLLSGNSLAQQEDLEITPATAPVPQQEVAADLSQFRFLDCLQRGLMGEIWSVQTAEGRQRVTYHLHGLALTNPTGQVGAFRQLRSLPAAGVMPFEILEHGPNRIVLLTDYYERSLRDCLQEVRMAGKQGLQRDELLGLLAPLAATLDKLSRKHQLHHWGLHPGNLFLHDERLLMGEFGWLQLFWQGGPQTLDTFNPRYAAPELADNRPCAASDQYSLALIYAELLTGQHPIRTTSGSRPGSGRYRLAPAAAVAAPMNGPDLTLLKPQDRDIITRALVRDPARRFASCSELVEALVNAGAAQPTTIDIPPRRSGTWAGLGRALETAGARLSAGTIHASRALVQQLVQKAQGDTQACTGEGCRYFLLPGQRLRHECGVLIPGTGFEALLDGFRKQTGATVLGHQAGSWTLQVDPGRSVWRSLWSKQGGLRLHLEASELTPGRLNRVQVTIEPVGCVGTSAVELLANQGPALLETLRSALRAIPELREDDRFPWEQPVLVTPIWPKGLSPQLEVQGEKTGEAGMVAQARDLSLSGIGLLLPQEPPTTQLRVKLPCLSSESGSFACEMLATVRIARLRPLPTGWFEVGAAFLW